MSAPANKPARPSPSPSPSLGALDPLFSFGLVADVQYARGKAPKVTSSGSTRRYADAVGMLRQAVRHWQGGDRHPRVSAAQGPASRLGFVLHLGDIIDGNETPEATMQDLEESAAAFDQLGPLPVYHAVGNHCLAAPREALVNRLPCLRDRPQCYYSAPIEDGWRLVVLDTTEMSLHSGYPQDSEIAAETRAFLDSHLPEQHPQVLSYNGGIGSRQMRWLNATLEEAAHNGESVIVAAHHPIACARESHRAWNAQGIEEVLAKHSSVVKLVLTGHDHGGGYAARGSIHHVTLEGMVEAPEGSNAYAIVRVCSGSIEIEGHGVATSRSLPF